MKTEQLIDMLSTNLEPVRGEKTGRKLAWAIVAGGAGAFGVMLLTVRLRPTVYGAPDLGFLVLKLLFMVSLIGSGAALLSRLIRPGHDGRKLFGLILLPFLAIGLAGVVRLALAHPTAWSSMILGAQWATCLFCIPLFAVVPFAVLIGALRQGAPTDLRRTGAVAGLVAGSLGAVAYAFYCPDDSLPFIALWYGGMVALCALIGAMIGPRLLRW